MFVISWTDLKSSPSSSITRQSVSISSYIDHLNSSKNPEDFLADCVEDEFLPKKKFQGLPVHSDTRWLTRVDSICCLLQNYRAVCEAVEAIRDRSTGKSASDADSHLKRILPFEFLVSAIICCHVLAYIRCITVALHAKECDLYKAYEMAQRLVTSLESEKTSDRFQALWKVIMKVSTDLFIEPPRKRSVKRQQNRSNPVVDTESYYRVRGVAGTKKVGGQTIRYFPFVL